MKPSTPPIQGISPDAIILISPDCPHCAKVIQSLMELVKTGAIGQLQIVNIAIHPEIARQFGTRSVPWTRIGNYEISGAVTDNELSQWVSKAGNEDNTSHDYVTHLLETNRLDIAINQVAQTPQLLAHLVPMLNDLEIAMGIRIGIGALLEEFEAKPTINQATQELIKLASSEHASVRADAAHYLALTHDSAVKPVLHQLLNDNEEEVREIAQESLEIIK